MQNCGQIRRAVLRQHVCGSALPTNLRGVFRERRQMFAVILDRGDNLHLLPVVGKLSAAIEAGNVSPGQGRCLRTRSGPANGHGKTVMGMLAAKYRFIQFCDHTYLPRSSGFSRAPVDANLWIPNVWIPSCSKALGISAAPQIPVYAAPGLLDSRTKRRVSHFVRRQNRSRPVLNLLNYL